MTTHFSQFILAWEIPWVEEPDGLHRVRGREELDTTERTHARCIKFFSLEKLRLSVGVSIAYLFTFQAKPKLIEPLDYENVIVQKKTQILNDCLREMLLFPYDDFQVRVNSTVRSSFTNSSFLSLGLLLG